MGGGGVKKNVSLRTIPIPILNKKDGVILTEVEKIQVFPTQPIESFDVTGTLPGASNDKIKDGSKKKATKVKKGVEIDGKKVESEEINGRIVIKGKTAEESAALRGETNINFKRIE